MSADHDFQRDCGFRRTTLADVYFQVGHRGEQPGIIGTYLVPADVVLAVWLVIIPRRCSERAHHPFQIALVFQPDMFFDDFAARRDATFANVHAELELVIQNSEWR